VAAPHPLLVRETGKRADQTADELLAKKDIERGGISFSSDIIPERDEEWTDLMNTPSVTHPRDDSISPPPHTPPPDGDESGHTAPEDPGGGAAGRDDDEEPSSDDDDGPSVHKGPLRIATIVPKQLAKIAASLAAKTTTPQRALVPRIRVYASPNAAPRRIPPSQGDALLENKRKVSQLRLQNVLRVAQENELYAKAQTIDAEQIFVKLDALLESKAASMSPASPPFVAFPADTAPPLSPFSSYGSFLALYSPQPLSTHDATRAQMYRTCLLLAALSGLWVKLAESMQTDLSPRVLAWATLPDWSAPPLISLLHLPLPPSLCLSLYVDLSLSLLSSLVLQLVRRNILPLSPRPFLRYIETTLDAAREELGYGPARFATAPAAFTFHSLIAATPFAHDPGLTLSIRMLTRSVCRSSIVICGTLLHI
jgi:hypothetical protein